MVTNTAATMELVETGEKRDRVGRKITPAARREELVRAWQRSGLTQAEFARREGVRYPTFASWVQQARATSGARKPATAKARFAEACLPAQVQWPTSVAALTLEVRLTDGTVVRGASASEVVTLVRALRA
jgi:transposase-like protein